MMKVSSEVDCLHWLGYDNKENKELVSKWLGFANQAANFNVLICTTEERSMKVIELSFFGYELNYEL
jgi:hypothetical protein